MSKKQIKKDVEEILDLPDTLLKKLKSSDLDLEDYKILNMQYDPKATKFYAGFDGTRSAVKIPYFDLDGNLLDNEFFRIRYLSDPVGFAAQTKKIIRYDQVKDTMNAVYLSPHVEWRKIATNSGEPISITEGELKGACACKHGIPTVALGGVSMHQSSKRGVYFPPQLDEFEWRGRMVTIVYDSDWKTNPQVQNEMFKLGDKLVDRGCFVRFATIPSPDAHTKMGVDDYIVRFGIAAYTAILDEAQPYKYGTMLADLNEEFGLIWDQGVLVELKTAKRFKRSDFIEATHADRKIPKETIKIGNNGQATRKTEILSLPREWLSWPGRRVFKGVKFDPGNPEYTTADGYYNGWRGWGVEPKEGDIQPWLDMVEMMLHYDPEHIEWFHNWCGYPFAHPGRLLYTAVLIWSQGQGIGKTSIFYALMSIYGEHAVEVNESMFEHSFTAWQEYKQFILYDDITSSEHKKRNMGILKSNITAKEIYVNEKGLPAYTMPNVANKGMTSNSADAMWLDENDRRIAVFEGPRSNSDEYKIKARAFNDWWQSGGNAIMFDWFLKRDYSGFNPVGEAPTTRAKSSMIDLTSSEATAWAKALSIEPEYILRSHQVLQAHKECDMYLLSELYSMFKSEYPNTNAAPRYLSKELKAAGLHTYTKLVRTKSRGPQRIIFVRNGFDWQKAPEHDIMAHFDKFRA